MLLCMLWKNNYSENKDKRSKIIGVEKFMAEEKKITRKKIEATKLMNKYMSDYFYELDRASKADDEKVAWCTSVGPSELLL